VYYANMPSRFPLSPLTCVMYIVPIRSELTPSRSSVSDRPAAKKTR